MSEDDNICIKNIEKCIPLSMKKSLSAIHEELSTISQKIDIINSNLVNDTVQSNSNSSTKTFSDSPLQDIDNDTEKELKVIQANLSSAENEINAIKSSLSWKITAPLRFMKSLIDRVSPLANRALLGILRWLYQKLPLGEGRRYRLNRWLYTRVNHLFQGTSILKLWEGTRIAEAQVDLLPDLKLTPPDVATEETLVLPTCLSPKYSIIVYLDGSQDEVLIGLKSLLDACDGEEFELLVVGDVRLATSNWLNRRVRGWKIIAPRAHESLVSWNDGIQQALGEYLVFLRFPAHVLPGWLGEMAWVMRNHPDAGAVGTQVLFSDGFLLESGCCIILHLNILRRLGFGKDPRHSDFCHVREVDCFSTLSWMMPKRLALQFQKVTPQPVEVVLQSLELAQFVWSNQLKLFRAPLSRLILPERLKATYEREVTLHTAAMAPPGSITSPTQTAGHVLFLDTWTPTPDQDAGSLYILSFFQILRELKYDLTFLPIGDFQYTPKYTPTLQRMGVECQYAPFVHGVQEHLRSHGSRYALIFLYKVHLAGHYLDMVRQLCPHAKIVFNTVDLHYIREERQALVENSDRLRQQAQQTKQKELAVMKQVDMTILLSTHEHEILRQEPSVADRPFAHIPLIQEIPGCQAPFEGRHDILFIGGFEHQPNVDAALFLTQRIWPLVCNAIPHITLYILGSKPTQEIRNLATKDIVVTGYIPDITPYFKNCRLSVAPLRFGAGLKGKVISSLSHGLPCVATALAVEGSGLTNGKEVLVVDDPEAMAMEIIRLHQDRELWYTLSQNGLDFMEQNFSFQAGKK